MELAAAAHLLFFGAPATLGATATTGGLLTGGAAGLGSVATGLSLAGTAGKTLSDIQASRAGSRAARAEARSMRESAAFEEAQFRKRAAQLLAKQRAIGAASGVDISSGSPLTMMLDSAREAELEALSIRRSGEIGAEGKKFESRLARRRIPGQAFAGVAKTGSILSQWLGG